MTAVMNTVKDLSRAVAALDEHALSLDPGDMRRQVAANLAWQFGRKLYRSGIVKSRRDVVKRDVAVALAAHGASCLTIETHARVIAAIIRADYTDGGAAC
jgi:hypothetical protein